MEDWRAIETAPKDGTRILLGRFVLGDDCDNRVAVDYWHFSKDHGFFGWGKFNERFWPATHWMPLPARPALTHKEEKP